MGIGGGVSGSPPPSTVDSTLIVGQVRTKRTRLHVDECGSKSPPMGAQDIFWNTFLVALHIASSDWPRSEMTVFA